MNARSEARRNGPVGQIHSQGAWPPQKAEPDPG